MASMRGIRIRSAGVLAVVVVCVTLVVAPAQAHAQTVDAPGCRSIPVPADVPLRSAEARAAFGVDGTGVSVGVISNSFDTSGETPDWEADIALGVLPGPGNPCGRETPVRVISESATEQDDEGRAMAQLVHGIAPGAELLFASAGGSADDSAYADAIRALVDAGADIIVDDIPGNVEPAFQRGVIGNAVQAAVDAGVLYIAAAGNDGVVGSAGYPSAGMPIGAWQTAAYRPMECAPEVSALYPAGAVDCMDFDPSDGQDALASITLAAGALVVLPRLVWAEPYGGVQTVLEHVTISADGPAGRAVMQNPARPAVQGGAENMTPDPSTQSVAIVRRLDTGTPSTPAVRWVLQSIGFPSIVDFEYYLSSGPDVVGATLIGHEGDPAALAVAAVNVDTLTIEAFSSMGPSELLFEPVRADGATAGVLSEPIVVPGPAVAGVQRLPISFDLGASSTFAGTSAAAPTVAAVGALALQAAPSLSVGALRAAIVATANASVVVSPYPALVDPARARGAGLVDAYALVDAVTAPTPVPSASGEAVPAAEDEGSLAVSGSTPGLAVALALALLLSGAAILRVRRRALPQALGGDPF